MALKSFISKDLLKNPIFWIVLFGLIRFTGLLNPPLETGHNWRQVTGLMVSRNFLEVDANILYPRVDDNQGKSGIIGMEFPVMNYLVFLISKLFGYQHWYGRLIGLIVSSFGLFSFYQLVLRWFNSRTAIGALLFLIGSIWFSYSRKMMPDVFCIALMLMSINFADLYLRSGRWKNALYFILLFNLSILAKIPAAIYTPVIIVLIYQYKAQTKRSLWVAFGIAIGAILSYSWYFVWCPHLSEIYGSWYNSGQSFLKGWEEISSNWNAVFKNFYFNSFYSYLAFAIAILGIFFALFKKNKALLIPSSLVFGVFVIYIIKSGFYFHHHNYYIIPFVPIMALLAGYSLSLIKSKNHWGLIIAIALLESIANQQHDFFIKDSEKYKMKLESISEQYIPKGSLIAINSNGNPQEIYFSHRKGWLESTDSLNSKQTVKHLREKGCSYLIFNKNIGRQETKLGEIIFEDDNYQVVQLN